MDTDFSGLNNKRPLYNHQTCSQSPDNTILSTRMRTSKNQYKQPNTLPEHARLSQQPLMKGSHLHILKLWHKLMFWACGQLNLWGAQRSS